MKLITRLSIAIALLVGITSFLHATPNGLTSQSGCNPFFNPDCDESSTQSVYRGSSSSWAALYKEIMSGVDK